MNCPDSEVLAAHAEGALEPEESARLLEHAADCDGCRRELALLELSRAGAGAGLPARLRARTLKAALRPSRAPRFPARAGSRGPAAAFAAAAVVLLAAGLLALAMRRDVRPAPAPKAPVAKPEPRPEAPAPPREEPRAVARTEPPVLPPVPPPAEPPLPAPVPEPPKPEPSPLPEPPAEAPRPGETRPEPAPAPAHTIAARALGEIALTDFSGSVTIRRKGAAAKAVERPAGMARLAEGDVLASDKGAGFRVGGVHPVVLGENTAVSMAWVAQEQAPWLHVRAGEVTVDSTGPTRWVVSDGAVAVVIKQAQARFAAAPGKGLRVSALSDPLFVEPDGGRVHAVRPGEELEVARGSADLRALEAAKVDRALAAFHAARPRHRTVFFASCDPVDARREHYFLQEGGFLKNEALLSKERPDRSVGVTLAPNPRFAWRDGLLLRFRVRTNAQRVNVSLRAEERRYTLLKDVDIDRRQVHTWVAFEVPLPIGDGAMGFRRDDGLNQLTFTFDDKYDLLRFEAKAKDVFGDQRGYLLVDDIQVVQKD